MCECINNSEKALTELFFKDVKISDGNVRVVYDNKSLMIDSGNIQFYGNAEALYKIGKRSKKWSRNILFTFCPLCGERYLR